MSTLPVRTKKNPQAFADYSLAGLKKLVKAYSGDDAEKLKKTPDDKLLTTLKRGFELKDGSIRRKYKAAATLPVTQTGTTTVKKKQSKKATPKLKPSKPKEKKKPTKNVTIVLPSKPKGRTWNDILKYVAGGAAAGLGVFAVLYFDNILEQLQEDNGTKFTSALNTAFKKSVNVPNTLKEALTGIATGGQSMVNVEGAVDVAYDYMENLFEMIQKYFSVKSRKMDVDGVNQTAFKPTTQNGLGSTDSNLIPNDFFASTAAKQTPPASTQPASKKQKSKSKTKTDETAQLRKQIADLERELALAENRTTSLMKSNDSLVEAAEDLAKAMEEENPPSSSSSSYELAEEARLGAKTIMESMKESKAAHQSEIDKSKQQQQTAEQSMEQIGVAQGTVAGLINKFEDLAQALKDNIDRLGDDLKQKRNDEDYGDALTALSKEANSLEENLKSQSAKISSLTQASNAFRKTAEEAEQSIKNSSSLVEAQNEVISQAEQVERLAEKTAEVAKDVETSSAKIKALNTVLQEQKEIARRNIDLNPKERTTAKEKSIKNIREKEVRGFDKDKTTKKIESKRKAVERTEKTKRERPPRIRKVENQPKKKAPRKKSSGDESK